jgi:hypothetical protein
MTQPKEKAHTLKPLTKSQFLPPLQKRILLCLAKSHPRTINETKGAIKGHYKSTWTAFNSLEEKGIITKIGTKEYRGNEYPRFWLTTAGVFIALIEGVNPKPLLSKTIDTYPENKVLQCIVEVSTILGTDMYEIAYSAILKKRNLEENDTSAMLATQLQKDLSLEQIKELITVMKKYPEQFGHFKEQTDQMLENLKKVELFLKEA